MRKKVHLLALRYVMFEPQTLMEAVRRFRLWPLFTLQSWFVCLGRKRHDIGDPVRPRSSP